MSILIIETHYIALWVDNSNNVTYFHSFGVEHIPKEIKIFINHPLSSALQDKDIKTFSEYKHIIQ